MANHIVTKTITGISGQTLQAWSGLSTLLSASSNNWIKKIVFVLEANANLTAQSTAQNISCFASEGDNIKLAANPVGATTYQYFELSPDSLIGTILDLRTALKFTATGNVHAIIFF